MPQNFYRIFCLTESRNITVILQSFHWENRKWFTLLAPILRSLGTP